MKPILTSGQMADADRYTIEVLGVPGLELMECAAQACVKELEACLEADSSIAVIAGGGNNGGDGFAIARLLRESGREVEVFTVFPEEKLAGDALVNFRRMREAGIPSQPFSEPFALPGSFSWIVDAVFGTGLNRPVTGRLARMIEALNGHPARILSVDLPSGLSGNEGRLLGAAIQADLTVTFQCLKLAHAVTPACLRCGRVVVRDIGIRCPPSMAATAHFLEEEDYRREKRPPDSHKGSFGSMAVIGGFAGMEGAASLCGLAALRFGAGKVRIYTNRPGGRFHHDSVMVAHIDRFEKAADYQVLVVGPGLTRSPEAFEFLASLDLGDVPVVWDADGLWYLKRKGIAAKSGPWAMTPHPGEAAMLLDSTTEKVQADRLWAIRELGSRYSGGWILLKGFRTLLLAPDGELFVCSTGNAALATAGSGDVLSGMIGSLLAQGLDTADSVLLACIRHGMAADRWVRHYTEHSMLAEDIIDDLKL